MKILMLSWEFPPQNVGGLAQHVYDLSQALVKEGQEVHLLTFGSPEIKSYENVKGVKVYRVNPYPVSSLDFISSVMQLNIAMLERAINLFQEVGEFDLIHAHDWLVAYVARALKHAYKLPLVSTIHATEFGRNYGLHNEVQRHISDVEWWLGYESWRVICCSKYMEQEIQRIFQIPQDKIKVIPNGVNVENFFPLKGNLSRDFYASSDEKIVFYIGRLVREKGVQVLVDAIPLILAQDEKVKFIIAGKGPYSSNLQEKVRQMGIENRVYFTGYIDEETKNSLYNWSNVAVFPSLYEPFGIVALEAMAAKIPVIVSDTGGLGEIVEHGVDGLKVYTGSPKSLADMILWVLKDSLKAKELQEKAYEKVCYKFNWQEIANQTILVYQEVYSEMKESFWQDKNQGVLNRFAKLWTRQSI